MKDDLIKVLKEVVDLINCTQGVAGWHLNGDVLPWDQIDCIQGLVDYVEYKIYNDEEHCEKTIEEPRDLFKKELLSRNMRWLK